MANRVFQSVIYQMKDAINRVVGVVDETGAVISCSELNLIGEVREGFMAERLTAGDRFVRDGYTYQQFSSAKHNDYAVFVEGVDETAGQFAAMLSISLQSIKQYHDEKFDKSNFIKNVVLDNILPGDIYAKARELHFATDVSRVVFIVRVTSGGDISAYDVVSSLFPDKQKDFVFNISETDTVLVKEIRKGIDRTDMEKLAASIVDTLSGEHYIKAVVGIGTPIGNIKDLLPHARWKNKIIQRVLGIFRKKSNFCPGWFCFLHLHIIRFFDSSANPHFIPSPPRSCDLLKMNREISFR